jgi:hypothetical protein
MKTGLREMEEQRKRDKWLFIFAAIVAFSTMASAVGTVLSGIAALRFGQ